MGFDGSGMFGWFGHLVGVIVSGLFAFFAFLVVIGLIFLLVRFLLVATRAAHIYVAKNSPTPPAPAAARATTVAKPATKPAAKPRTPKSPGA